VFISIFINSRLIFTKNKAAEDAISAAVGIHYRIMCQP